MNERKGKISTCVYVHSILHHWACILIFEGYFIEYVCWWEFVCELSEILFFFVFTLSCILREMSDLLLGALGHCPFHHYIHCWCDFTSCWIWANHHSSLCFFASPSLLFFSFDSSSSSHPLSFSYSNPFPGLTLSLHHHCTPHYQFDFLHCVVVVIIFTLGIFRSMAHDFLYMLHFIHEGMGFDHWVFELSFSSFLLPYHPNLR